MHKVKYFRKGVNLFRKTILRKVLFEILELMRCSLGLLSVVSRWNGARYKRGERNGNLNKSTFCVWEFFSLFYVLRFSSEWGLFGRNTRSAIRGTSSSFVRLRFLSRLWLERLFLRWYLTRGRYGR